MAGHERDCDVARWRSAWSASGRRPPARARPCGDVMCVCARRRSTSPRAVSFGAELDMMCPCGARTWPPECCGVARSSGEGRWIARAAASPGSWRVRRRPAAALAYWPWAGIGSASAARPGGASKGSAKYWVSCAARPSLISMTLSEYVGTPSYVITHSLSQRSPPPRSRRMVKWRSAGCPPRCAWIVDRPLKRSPDCG